jgi:hypothetical protein
MRRAPCRRRCSSQRAVLTAGCKRGERRETSRTSRAGRAGQAGRGAASSKQQAAASSSKQQQASRCVADRRTLTLDDDARRGAWALPTVPAVSVHCQFVLCPQRAASSQPARRRRRERTAQQRAQNSTVLWPWPSSSLLLLLHRAEPKRGRAVCVTGRAPMGHLMDHGGAMGRRGGRRRPVSSSAKLAGTTAVQLLRRATWERVICWGTQNHPPNP